LNTRIHGHRVVDRITRYRPLVLAIHDPRWFMRAISILDERGIGYSVFEDEKSIPYYSVLYTDYYYYVDIVRSRGDVLIVYDPDDSCRGLEKSILATRFKEYYNELVIGIDPGVKPYIVVVGDEEILEHKMVEQDILTDYIRSTIKCYPARRRIVRIGGGYNGWKIVFRIKDVLDIPIEVVDEEETTPRSKRVDDPIFSNRYFKRLSRYRNKDAYAALKIALRKGIEVI
jgi:hypothetical protein